MELPPPVNDFDVIARAWADRGLRQIEAEIAKEHGLPLLETHRAHVHLHLAKGIRQAFSEIARLVAQGVDVREAIINPHSLNPPKPQDPPSPV